MTGTVSFHFNAGYLELRNVTVCELHIGYRNHIQNIDKWLTRV